MAKRKNGLPVHCTLITDRHGKRRIRFRARGFSTYLPFPPNTADFDFAYRAALAGVKEWQANIGESKSQPGSISALIAAFYRTPEYTALRASTARVYRLILEKFREEWGAAPVAQLRRDHIKQLISARHKTPHAANRLLSLLRILLNLAMDLQWIAANPALGMKGFPKKTAGHHSWTEDDVAQFEACHPIGSKARLAFSLLLYTGQRRSDVIRMGRQHIRSGAIQVTQQKTGTSLSLPIHSELQRALDSAKSGHMTFLITELGAAFTPAGFGNWFRVQCDSARLPHCSAHGLRKCIARRLAEAGCSASVIGSVTGHKSLAELETYTRAADQVALAQTAMKALTGSKAEHNLSNLDSRLDKNLDKLLK